MKHANIIATCACGGSGHLIHTDAGFYVKCENAPHWYAPPIYCTEKKAVRCWNDMQKDMDELARDAMVADHRGISYGNYIPIKGKLPEQPTPKPLPVQKENKKICAICGGEIPKGTFRTKYCGGSCADIALIRQRYQYRKKKEK